MNGFTTDALDFRSASFDEDQFDRFYEEYFPQVYNLIYFQCRGSVWVEELTGQVFEKILYNLPRYDLRKGSLSAWICTITRNHLRDHYRSRKHLAAEYGEEILLDQADPEDGPEERALRKERQTILVDLLHRLPDRDREILILKFYGGLRSREIAMQLSMNEGAVNMSVSRSMKKLKGMAQPQLFD